MKKSRNKKALTIAEDVVPSARSERFAVKYKHLSALYGQTQLDPHEITRTYTEASMSRGAFTTTHIAIPDPPPQELAIEGIKQRANEILRLTWQCDSIASDIASDLLGGGQSGNEGDKEEHPMAIDKVLYCCIDQLLDLKQRLVQIRDGVNSESAPKPVSRKQ